MSRKVSHKSKRKPKVAKHLLSKPAYQGEHDMPTTVTLIQYDSKQTLIKDLSTSQDIKAEIAPNMVNWFKIVGISDAARIADICYAFGLQTFDVKDLMSDQQVVKVVAYDDITFLLMPGFSLDGGDKQLRNIQVGFIIGKDYVVSFQETDIPIFNDIQSGIEENQIQIRQRDNDYLLYILLRVINMMYNNTIIAMEDHLADIEDQIYQPKNSSDIMTVLRNRRLDYIRMKRFIVSLREEYVNLLHNTNHLIKDGNLIFFNDFDDKLRTALSNLEAFHESLISLLDEYYNNNNLRMNEIMKQLTIVATIFIPLTFLVGVWGMNFRFMPELEWQYGYFISWGLFAAVVVFVCIWMKRKGWF
jgi:magnesium transporter